MRGLHLAVVLGCRLLVAAAMAGGLACCAVTYAQTPGPQPAKKPDERAWGIPLNGQALSITTDKKTYAPLEPIILTIFFKNVGQKPVRVTEDNAFLNDYDIKVRQPDNDVCPWTAYGRRKHEVMTTATRGFNLEPGGERICILPLNRLFDMTRDAVYTIMVGRNVILANGGVFMAVSNRLEVKVDESLWLQKAPPEKAREQPGKGT